jgi:putative oxidoreductase
MKLLERLEPWGYVALRLVYAAIILTHGIPKALRIPHGSIADPLMATTGMIQRTLGGPFAFELAILVTLLETAGALLLGAGVLTRIVGAAFVVEMAGICLAMGPTWPWTDRGIEYPALLAMLAAYFVVRGPR